LRRHRAAGFLFLGASVSSIPSLLLLEPQPALEVFLLPLAGIVTGLLCLSMPWQRLPWSWTTHAVLALATIEIAVAVEVADRGYALFYVFVAVLAAYALPSRREIAAQLALISLALLLPLLYGGDIREVLWQATLAAPALALAAGTVTYLRERLEAKQRLYRRFAEEVLDLALRIRGEPAPIRRVPAVTREGREAVIAAGQGLNELAGRAASLGIRRARRSTTARIGTLIVGMVLAGPFATVGLATAGVSVPEPLREPFEKLGIELPNQAAAGPSATSTQTRVSTDSVAKAAGATQSERRDAGRKGHARPAPDTTNRARERSTSPGQQGGGATQASETAEAPAPNTPAPPEDPAISEPGGAPQRGGTPSSGPLDDVLDAPSDLLREPLGYVLGGLRRDGP
jgi:hypothetical protein